MQDTIVGIATAPGEGGVAIVRVSGENAGALLERVFRAAKQKPPYDDHRLMYGHADGYDGRAGGRGDGRSDARPTPIPGRTFASCTYTAATRRRRR